MPRIPAREYRESPIENLVELVAEPMQYLLNSRIRSQILNLLTCNVSHCRFKPWPYLMSVLNPISNKHQYKSPVVNMTKPLSSRARMKNGCSRHVRTLLKNNMHSAQIRLTKPPLELTAATSMRYERERPGKLIHMDVKRSPGSRMAAAEGLAGSPSSRTRNRAPATPAGSRQIHTRPYSP